MNKKRIGTALLAGAFVLGAASTASALQTQNSIRRDSRTAHTMEDQQANADKRALRERIRDTH